MNADNRSKPHVKLPLEASITLLNHGIYQFGNALSTIFVNLYLWRLTNDLWINGAYNLLVLISAPIATVFVGKLAKQKDRLLAYRLGIFLTAIFYLCILLAKEAMVQYFVVFAILRGVSNAFYWLGHFTMIYDVTNNENRHRYLGFNLIVTNAAMLAGPSVSGLMIGMFDGLQGYTIIYTLAFVMFLVSTLISLKMKPVPAQHKTYYLKYTWQMIRKYPQFGRSLFGWFILGFPQGIMSYIPAILLYQAIPKESFVGYINVGFTALTMIASYGMAKTATEERTKLYLLIAAWAVVLSALPLTLGMTLWTVILFMVIYSLSKPLQTNSYTAHYYKMSSALPLKENFKIEAVVTRETSINMGRASGIVVFMLFSSQMDGAFMAWVLVFAMATQLFINRLIFNSRDHAIQKTAS
ncbi:MFS transporter [Paenibacillus turpanensis]|uniref:MFS transporter n=1 Tax=Paenibacillus turpanensis TaxID=2689078 RepID=UPI00140A893B|nr:MFS transporter [Paenibacillus turpanensis]